MEEQINHIKSLTCKKHIKIFKLHQLGLKNKEIARIIQTSVGRVWNCLKDYKNNSDKVEAANAI